MKHYKIVNSTKQLNGTGKHRKGFFVSISPTTMVYPGEHTIVENITPGILGFQKCGYVKIEPIEDINIELENQIKKIEKENSKKRRMLEAKLKELNNRKIEDKKEEVKQEIETIENESTESVISTSLSKEAMKQAVKDANDAPSSAIVTNGGSEDDSLEDIEEAVSVDGEPNFVVQAGSKGKKGKKGNR